MFDFSKTVNPQRLTPEFILSQISDYQIFAYYFGHFKVGRSYQSRLRKDGRGSAGFYFSNKGEVIYKDFSYKPHERLNCFAYVKELYNCNFGRALEIVAQDFGLTGGSTKVPQEIFSLEEIDRDPKKNLSLIQIDPKPWDRESLLYWKYYEITEKELVDKRIYSVNRAFVNKKQVPNKDEQRYAYYQPYKDDLGDRCEGIKLYTPTSEQFKWINSIPIDIPFDADMLRFETDTVWVAKSKKDDVVLSKFHPDVIATQNESKDALTEELLIWLHQKYRFVKIFFGADPQALGVMKEFRSQGLECFHTPIEDYEKHRIEDPADFIRAYGHDALKDLLHSINLL